MSAIVQWLVSLLLLLTISFFIGAGFHVCLSAKKVVQPFDLGDHVSVLSGLLLLPRTSPCIAVCEPETQRRG